MSIEFPRSIHQKLQVVELKVVEIDVSDIQQAYNNAFYAATAILQSIEDERSALELAHSETDSIIFDFKIAHDETLEIEVDELFINSF
jgi:hypothetical protein